ncbi:MAG: hypothetical protein IIZ43_00405 [Eubacterium sp.]|nr:hypothetical protein [Eubacterium sp.]
MDRVGIIARYAAMMAALPYATGDMAAILLKDGGRCYMTDDFSDFRDIKPVDILDVTDFPLPEKDALMRLSECGAMILFKTPYAGICVDSGHPVRASLDDMAQIVGSCAEVCPRDAAKICGALRSSYAVLIDRRHAVCVGRNLYEAYTALTVLEKQAEVMLKAAVIGGARPLSAAECALMRAVYKRKYSKAEKEFKDDSEG